MADTPRLKLPLLDASQAQKHVTHNEALLQLDLLTGVIPVLDRSLTAPPGASDGAVYILGGTGTGAWTGFSANDLALRIDGGWRRVLPSRGMLAIIADENGLLVWFDGAGWTVSLAGAGFITETAAFTAAAAHFGATVRFDRATSANITLPASAPVGTSLQVLQVGVGEAVFVAGSGATLHQDANHTRSFARWSLCGAVVESNAGSAASWVLYGSTKL